jgi:hypothetical protein
MDFHRCRFQCTGFGPFHRSKDSNGSTIVCRCFHNHFCKRFACALQFLTVAKEVCIVGGRVVRANKFSTVPARHVLYIIKYRRYCAKLSGTAQILPRGVCNTDILKLFGENGKRMRTFKVELHNWVLLQRVCGASSNIPQNYRSQPSYYSTTTQRNHDPLTHVIALLHSNFRKQSVATLIMFPLRDD